MNRTAHAPERQPGESREQYLERRQFSRNVPPAATGGWYGNAKATSRQLQRDQRRDAFPKVGGHPRDAHGAVTFVGPAYECVGVEPTSREFVLSGGKEASGERFYTARRIWLAGISAQRGF